MWVYKIRLAGISETLNFLLLTSTAETAPGSANRCLQPRQGQVRESVPFLRYVESNIPDFEANPRLLRFTREGGTDSVCTSNGLLYKVINHNEWVVPVCHKRAQVHVILSFVRQFFFMETENVIDDIYSNESGGQDAVPMELWGRAYQ
jgi:hypothetical protein